MLDGLREAKDREDIQDLLTRPGEFEFTREQLPNDALGLECVRDMMVFGLEALIFTPRQLACWARRRDPQLGGYCPLTLAKTRGYAEAMTAVRHFVNPDLYTPPILSQNRIMLMRDYESLCRPVMTPAPALAQVTT